MSEQAITEKLFNDEEIELLENDYDRLVDFLLNIMSEFYFEFCHNLVYLLRIIHRFKDWKMRL